MKALNKLTNSHPLVGQSLFYALANASNGLFSIISLAILTRTLSLSEYGTLDLLLTSLTLFITFAAMNFNSGTFFHYFNEDNPEKKKQVLSTALIFQLLSALSFTAIMFANAESINTLLTQKDSNTDFTPYLKILSALLLVCLLDTHFKSLLRMLKKANAFLALTLCQIFLNLSGILIFTVKLKLGITGVFYANLIANSVSLIIGAWLTRQQHKCQFSKTFFLLILAYCLPQFPSVIINWLTTQSNRFFMNHYLDLNQIGIFAVAMKVAMIFFLCISAFRMAWEPYALSIMKQTDAKQTYKKWFHIYYVGFGLIAALVAFFAKELILLLSTEQYLSGYKLVPFLVVSFLLLGANNIVGIGVNISKKTHYISIAQFFAFLTVIALNFILIPTIGTKGAAIAVCTTTLVQFLAIYHFAQKVWPAHYDIKRVLIFITTVLSLCLLNNYCLETFPNTPGLIINLLFSILTITASLLWIKHTRHGEIFLSILYKALTRK